MRARFATSDSFHFADIRDGTSNTLASFEQNEAWKASVENDETHWVGSDRMFRPEMEDEVIAGFVDADGNQLPYLDSLA